MTTPSASSEDLLVELAAELHQAETNRVAVPPLAARTGLAADDAYRVQAANTARRLAAGDRFVGHKVGLTSVAMQRQLGVDEPDFGVVFDSMLLADGATVRLDQLIAPRVEAEIAFRLGADLGGPHVTDDDARAAVAEVLLALEVIDSRIADWKITLADTIADNASSARMVTGPARPTTPGLLAALPVTEITLCQNGESVAGGTGAAVLGDPIKAVTWLARRLSGFGEQLRAGELVLAGAVHASIPLTHDTELSASAPGFAPVRLSVR